MFDKKPSKLRVFVYYVLYLGTIVVSVLLATHIDYDTPDDTPVEYNTEAHTEEEVVSVDSQPTFICEPISATFKGKVLFACDEKKK